MNIKWTFKSFQQLTITELYDLLQLRTEVFVVEQDCVYQDMDGTDQIAIHLLAYQQKDLVATARIFLPTDNHPNSHIGRVVVKQSWRKQQLGHELMKNCIQHILTAYPKNTIEISAQQYLIKFYETHGFSTVGQGYLEDGIPHIKMLRKS